MKCPLLTAISITLREDAKVTANDCWKEECAWWLDHDDRCAIKVTAECIAGLSQNVNEIKRTMPTKASFAR